MRKRILGFILIPLCLFVIVCIINICKRNVYINDEHIVYNDTKYFFPTEDENSFFRIFTVADEEQLIGHDIFGGSYYKSKMDNDSNIIYYKGFGSCTYIKTGFSIPKLDECFLKQIDVENNYNVFKNTIITFSENLVIYDIATPNPSINEKDLEYTNINLDIRFTNLEYLYINCITVFRNGEKYYLSIYGLECYLELVDEYTYILN